MSNIPPAKTKIQELLKLKEAIQAIEEDNEKDKKAWRKLGEKVRNQSQQIYQLKQQLFDMI